MSEQKGIEKAIHVIPLKKVYFGKRYNRADRAIRLIKNYLRRHYKEAEKILVDPDVNNYVWSRGRYKPPRRVVVEVRYDKENKVVKALLLRPSKYK